MNGKKGLNPNKYLIKEWMDIRSFFYCYLYHFVMKRHKKNRIRGTIKMRYWQFANESRKGDVNMSKEVVIQATIYVPVKDSNLEKAEEQIIEEAKERLMSNLDEVGISYQLYEEELRDV